MLRNSICMNLQSTLDDPVTGNASCEFQYLPVGVTDYVQRLDALAESGATEEVQPGASLTTLLHRPSQETYNILSSRSNTPLLPNLGGILPQPQSD